MSQSKSALVALGFILSFFIPSLSIAGRSLGVEESFIDTAVQPCDDFYQFACGKWITTAEIPSDLPMWSRATAVREANKRVLRRILEKYSAGRYASPKNPDAKKLGDFYAACMNEKQIEKSSLTELNAILKKIDDSDPKKNFGALLGEMHLRGVNSLFDFRDQQDFKNSTQVIGVLDQGGLGLPDRDYYLREDAKMLESKNLYQKFITNIFTLLGFNKVTALEFSNTILDIETSLAKHSMAQLDKRNPANTYHLLDRKSLAALVPFINWDQYFSSIDMTQIQVINVAVPRFFEGLSQLLSSVSQRDLKTYLRWHVIRAFIPALPNRFVDEDFNFVSKALSGQNELEPRWKRCVNMIDSQMGFALGRSYVAENYARGNKDIAQKMIRNIEKSFEDSLKKSTWIDNPTRVHALSKLHAIFNKVGYPKKWRNYGSLKIEPSSYLNTVMNANIYNSRYRLDKIGKYLDRADWNVSPPTVNAFYSTSLNEMIFPAGILQSPFFDKNASMEANYGAIGMLMGHELIHGFDDQGRQFDSKGNWVGWWTPEAVQSFEQRAVCVTKEYDAFEVLPGLYLDGKLTLGENIADHGGLRLAFSAWKKHEKKKVESVESKFTPEQRFFLGFAQSWCSIKQEKLVRTLVKTDVHSPHRFRVNGSVSQIEEFSAAFQCKPGSPMAPVNRCAVW